jgi:hypothetical protein
VVGTDHPFVPGQLKAVPELVRAAGRAGSISADTLTAILGANALELLGRNDPVGTSVGSAESR